MTDTDMPNHLDQPVDRNTCYLCHGKGHWARHCTSLPSVYLVDNPPKCYACGGIGHYARFCPSVDPSSRRGNFRPRALSDSWVYEYSCDPYLFDPALYYLTTSDLSDTPRTMDYIDATPVMPMHPTSHLPETTLDCYNFSEILDPQPSQPSEETTIETL